MTLTDQNGPATADNPGAGGFSIDAPGPAVADNPNPEGGAGTDQGSNGASVDTAFAALSSEQQAVVTAKGWGSVSDVLQSYTNLEEQLRDSTRIPGEGADDAQVEKAFRQLGKPESKDGYEFSRPENAPENFAYDDGLAGEFQNIAFKHHLTKDQAAGVHNAYVEYQAAQYGEYQNQVNQAVQTTADTISKEWGSPDSPVHQENREMVIRAVKGLNLTDSFKRSGLISSDGNLTDPALAFALQKVGSDMYKSDSLINVDEKVNPFDPKTENLAAQGELVKTDPERAKTLIRAAGLDPNLYFTNG